MSETLESLTFLRSRLANERTLIENEALLAGFDIALSILDDEISGQREWERINSLTSEELYAELAEAGYSKEHLEEMARKFKEKIKNLTLKET